MPKPNRGASHNNLRYAPEVLEMPGSIPTNTSQMDYYGSRSQALAAGYYEPMSASAAGQAAMPVASYDQYAVAPPLAIQTPTGGYASALPAQHRASSGAWSTEDDQTLLRARSQGLNWGAIMTTHFPAKTANACRKRHERLMERKGADDWDTIKLERLAREYMNMRKQIWTPLAQATGEKWNVVEQKCMSNGIKNLQSAARHGARREREGAHAMYDDDSGVSGIGLTPIDEQDLPFSSPSSAGSGPGSAGSSAYGSASHSGNGYAAAQGGYYTGHQQHHAAHHHQHHHHHGYSNSVSSTGTAAYGTAGSVGSHSPSPYMGHGGRLPSVDMGINTLINRGPGAGHQ